MGILKCGVVETMSNDGFCGEDHKYRKLSKDLINSQGQVFYCNRKDCTSRYVEGRELFLSDSFKILLWGLLAGVVPYSSGDPWNNQ
jgi:hypothetical protein